MCPWRIGVPGSVEAPSSSGNFGAKSKEDGEKDNGIVILDTSTAFLKKPAFMVTLEERLAFSCS